MKIEPKFLYPVLAAIPLLCLVYYVSEYMVDVPYMDQWGILPLFEKAYEGTLTFNDLWRQQGQQRPFFPRLIMIQLARLSKWKISYELATNILLSIATFLIIIYQIRITNKFIKNRKPCWLIPVISLIIFSLTQSRGWLWGWAMLFFLSVFAVTSGIVVLANFGSKWTGFCSAVLLGILGTYSFSNGLICWPIGLFILFFINYQDKKNKTLKLILWTAISIIIISSYLYTFQIFQIFQTKPGQPSVLSALNNPDKYIGYVLIYLGSPVYSYDPIIVGIFGLLGFVFSVCFIRGLIRQRNVEFQILVPYIALGLFAVGTALLTGIGRVGFGPAHARAPRYVTTSSLFWICNVALLYLYITTGKIQLQQKIINIPQAITGVKPQPPNETEQTEKLWHCCSREMTLQARAVSILTIVILLIFTNSIASTWRFKRKYDQLAPARKALIAGKSDDELLKHLIQNPDKMDPFIDVLKKYKLSVFRE